MGLEKADMTFTKSGFKKYEDALYWCWSYACGNFNDISMSTNDLKITISFNSCSELFDARVQLAGLMNE